MTDQRSRPVLSVIIVTWNSAEFLRETLESVFDQTLDSCEVILVENNSSDDSLAVAREFKKSGLKIINSKSNRGFCGGNNLGVSKSSGDFVFLLNPDTILEQNSLARIVEVLRNQSGDNIIGTKLLTADGKTILHCGGEVGVQAHCRLFGRGEKDNGQHDHPTRVEFVVGAAFGLSRNLWDKLGGFDEDFFPAYYEDSDICLRANRHGHEVWYHPIGIRHQENVSLPYKTKRFLTVHHRNRLMLIIKNFPLLKIIFRTLPAEISWLLSPNSKGVRKICLPLYFRVIPFLFRKRRLPQKRIPGCSHTD